MSMKVINARNGTLHFQNLKALHEGQGLKKNLCNFFKNCAVHSMTNSKLLAHIGTSRYNFNFNYFKYLC